MDQIQPFIENHQWNLVRKETGKLIYAIEHMADKRVIEALKGSVETAVVAGFPGIFEEQRELLTAFSPLNSKEELDEYITCVSHYRLPFPRITEQHIKKLFPKSKKMKAPNLAETDLCYFTYLGWMDIATNKQYFVYYKNGSIVGFEGTFSPAKSHNVCALCNTPGSPEHIGYLSMVCKAPANASPDYYKAVGNYVCLNSDDCNMRITDPHYLEYLVQQANSKWVSLA